MIACVGLGAAFVLVVALTVEPDPTGLGPSDFFIPSTLAIVAVPMAIAGWVGGKLCDQLQLSDASHAPKPVVEPPNRQWLTFNFRTMLIAVTILCSWLGWQANRVWERRTMRAWIRNQGGFVAKQGEVVPGPMLNMFRTRVAGHSREIPWLRRQLGDFRIRYVLTSTSWTDDEIDRVAAMFPEADIVDY
jgi:hypothetical protein